jgi:hypothetical protein
LAHASRAILLTLLLAAHAAGLLAARTAAAQAPNNPFTPVQPMAPDSGRPGQVIQLPGGGTASTTGGTAYYQTMPNPGGGAAVVLPNPNGSATVVAPGGQGGLVRPP